MKVDDIVKCDDWVFDGAVGVIVKLLYGGPTKIDGWPPNGAEILTSKGLRRVSIHNINVVNQ